MQSAKILTVLSLLLLPLVNGHGTSDCVNCLSVKDSEKKFEIVVQTTKVKKNKEKIKELQVYQNNKQIQSLPVFSESSRFPLGHPHEIAKMDLNGDGFPDFSLMTVNAINRYYDYYLFNPKEEKFHYLGNFPELEVKAKSKTIEAFVKDGGDSFRLVYQIKQNKLVEIKKEKLK